MKKYVYLFDECQFDKNIVGGKGAFLSVMSSLKLPIPKGFTISTEACNLYQQNKKLDKVLLSQIDNALKEVELKCGKKFGDKTNPLFLSVRSGARVSMPGMMDSILNIGLNDEILSNFDENDENNHYIYDSYRKFIEMYGNVVKKHDINAYEKCLEKILTKLNKDEKQLSCRELKMVIEQFKKVYEKQEKSAFPQDVKQCLISSICGVFNSWNNDRAYVYRKMHNIPYEWGTACNVQQMVFGNKNEFSGTGVAFSRNPSTGEDELYGEFLNNAQGEDIVAGIRTPRPISELEKVNAKVFKQFSKIAKTLEKHFKDMQEIEFTYENDNLFILQTRVGKRSARAGVKIAVDMAKSKLISTDEAIMRIEPKIIDSLLHPQFDEQSLLNATVVGQGLPASPGAGSGKIVFTPERAKQLASNGEDIILVREETSPEDIESMISCQGVLTCRGGMTSHAAVVARGMGVTAVVGLGDIKFAEDGKSFTLANRVFKEGDLISIDGNNGNVYLGKVNLTDAKLNESAITLLSWADKKSRLQVYANADNPRDAQNALNMGAKGIGLCRTEHMFFEEKKIKAMREMILSGDIMQREKALKKLLPMQKKDFAGIYKVMNGKDVTIRFLDPPLHEFLPKTEDEIISLAKDMKISEEAIKQKIEALKEFNPMMGHRGLRLFVTYPEIARMQTRAVLESAIEVQKEGVKVHPEIMIPLTCDVNEFEYVKNIIMEEADKIFKEQNRKISFKVGTMIEVPRACLNADEIALQAQFFSFGTNDITQMTYGFSRDDSGKFLDDYYAKEIFDFNPFSTIDTHGVGKLINMAVTKAKQTNKNLKFGVCGEHGGDPKSIEFFDKVGLDYVSCSPYRVLVARLAAAQSAIKNTKKLNKKPY